MTGPSQRGGHRPALALRLILWASTTLFWPACGPESYHQGAPRDARADLPGAGGSATGSGGAGGPEGGVGGGADGGGGSDAAIDAGYCGLRDAATATDAASSPFTMSWTFDDASGLQGWAHVGQPNDVRDATAQRFDPDDGYPDAGSARLVVPFNGASQQIAFGFNFPAPTDLSHQVLSARVRLNTCHSSGAVVVGLAYKSVAGVYEYAANNPVDITPGNGWMTLTMSIDNPGGFIDMSRRDADGGIILPDPAAALEVDVIIQSNNGPYGLTDLSVDSVGLIDDGTTVAADAASAQDATGSEVAADAPDAPAGQDVGGAQDASDARDAPTPGN